MRLRYYCLLAIGLLFIVSFSSCVSWYYNYGINSEKELKNPSSVPILIKALQAEDPEIREQALDALGEIIETVPASRLDSNEAIRGKTINSSGDKGTVPALVLDSNKNIRERVVKSPGGVEPWVKDAVPALLKTLRDPNESIREKAIESLGNIGPGAKDAVPALLKALLDSDRGIREKAIISIKKIGYLDNVILESMKIVAANDPEPDVRIAASDVLQMFSLQNISQTTFKTEPSLVIDKKPKDSIFSIPNFYSNPRPNDIAIIIGIETYQNISQKSDYSNDDAQLIKEYLKALGFQERNIMYLTNERASLSGLRKSFEVWLPNNIKENSKVFIYYSGHGAPDAKGNGYIVPFDGDPGYLEVTGYPIDKLYANLESLKAAEIMVVMDSCFSGAGGKSILPAGARPISLEVKNPILLSDKIAIISSSKMNQISTSYSEKTLGLFTYYFLTALKEGKMTFADIYSYVKPMVEDEARKMNVEQSPQLLPGIALPGDKFSLR